MILYLRQKTSSIIKIKIIICLILNYCMFDNGKFFPFTRVQIQMRVMFTIVQLCCLQRRKVDFELLTISYPKGPTSPLQIKRTEIFCTLPSNMASLQTTQIVQSLRSDNRQFVGTHAINTIVFTIACMNGLSLFLQGDRPDSYCLQDPRVCLDCKAEQLPKTPGPIENPFFLLVYVL